MNLNDFLEKWGRTLFEAPLAAIQVQEPPELAEIRLALLDEAMSKSYRSGGRRVFPFDLLRVELRGVEQSRYSVFTGRFFQRYLEQEVCEALRSAGCRFPEDLRVEVDATVGLPARGTKWLNVAAASRDRTAVPARGKLVVREGAANLEELKLDKARVNIGRGVDVYRMEGIFRRNDLAFLEDDPVSRSVSFLQKLDSIRF